MPLGKIHIDGYGCEISWSDATTIRGDMPWELTIDFQRLLPEQILTELSCHIKVEGMSWAFLEPFQNSDELLLTLWGEDTQHPIFYGKVMLQVFNPNAGGLMTCVPSSTNNKWLRSILAMDLLLT